MSEVPSLGVPGVPGVPGLPGVPGVPGAELDGESKCDLPFHMGDVKYEGSGTLSESDMIERKQAERFGVMEGTQSGENRGRDILWATRGGGIYTITECRTSAAGVTLNVRM